MGHAKFVFISLTIVSFFLTFQNCSGPNSLAYPESETNESLSVPNNFEVSAGESLSLVAPIREMLGSTVWQDVSQLDIQWLYMNSTGQRELLSLSGPQIQLVDLLPEDSGTYQVQIFADEKVYRFNFLVRVFANQNTETSIPGSFSIQYQNTLCQSDLNDGMIQIDDVSYQDAHALCDESQLDPNIRQNRSIVCSFNGLNFMSIPSTEPRRDFIAQKQVNGAGAFQDAYILKAVGRCTAQVECRDYIQDQIAKKQITADTQVRCFWGREERIYAFGTTAPVSQPPSAPGGRDPGGGK